MKSQQGDKARMTCKGCKFIVNSNNTQVGCLAGRSEKFKARGELIDGDSVYRIKRFCNLYRDEDTDISVEEAKQQISPTFGIALFDNGDTDAIAETIDSVLATDYYLKKIAVVISAVNNPNVSELAHLINLLNQAGSKASKLVLTGIDVSGKIRDFDCFTHLSQASYLIKTWGGTIFPKSLFSNIDKSVNVDMEKNIFFESGEIQCVSFKAINGEYLNYDGYDATVQGIRTASDSHNMVKVYEK